MTREEAKKLLGEGATEDQVSAVLDQFHKEQNELKVELDKTKKEKEEFEAENKGLKEYKQKQEEERLTKLSEEEKIKEIKQKTDEEYAKARKTNNRISAKQILTNAGMSNEDAEEVLDTFVKEDANETIKSANILANQFKSMREKTKKETEDKLVNLDLTPNPSNVKQNPTGMTWDNFQNLSEEEQSKFAEEHPEEFAKL